MTSVLQDWVQELPWRQQGVLTLALRGPDGVTKEAGCKPLIRSLRGCVMNSAQNGRPLEVGERLVEGDDFMRMDLMSNWADWSTTCKRFFKDIDTYNIHFYQHLIHAAMILGYRHPNEEVGRMWDWFYKKACGKLHMRPETPQDMDFRLRDGPREEDKQERLERRA